MNEQYQKILVILKGSIGDVTRGLPIAKALRDFCPNAQIDWVVEPKSALVVKENPYLSNVILFDRPKGLKAFLPLLLKLRAERYDLVLDMQRHFKSGITSFATGAKRRIGFHRKNSKEFNWIFNTETIPYLSEDVSKLTHYLGFLTQLGVRHNADDLDFGLHGMNFSEQIVETVGKISGRSVGFVLGSSWSNKDWPVSGYVELAQRFINETSCEILLIGDPTQRSIAGKIVDALRSERIHDFVGKTSLKDACYLLKSAEVLIGPDSGPGHIAAAFKTPYVTLFGPTPPERVVPHGMEDLTVRASLGCMPCYKKGCQGLDKLCMRLISVDAVWAKYQNAVNNC